MDTDTFTWVHPSLLGRGNNFMITNLSCPCERRNTSLGITEWVHRGAVIIFCREVDPGWWWIGFLSKYINIYIYYFVWVFYSLTAFSMSSVLFLILTVTGNRSNNRTGSLFYSYFPSTFLYLSTFSSKLLTLVLLLTFNIYRLQMDKIDKRSGFSLNTEI